MLEQQAEGRAERLRSLTESGHRLYLGLLREVREGVYIRRTLQSNEPEFLLVESNGRYPDPPIDEELDTVVGGIRAPPFAARAGEPRSPVSRGQIILLPGDAKAR